MSKASACDAALANVQQNVGAAALPQLVALQYPMPGPAMPATKSLPARMVPVVPPLKVNWPLLCWLFTELNWSLRPSTPKPRGSRAISKALCAR